MRDQQSYENATDLVEIVHLSLTQLGNIWDQIVLQRPPFDRLCTLTGIFVHDDDDGWLGRCRW